ncbi:MAG: energy transducer TonB [Flavobacteriales bacterium]|nr:energy transducer TonB [Flavobacteriales bacterium]
MLGGVTEKRFAALREAAILHEANALVRTVDSLLQGGGLVRRGIFRSYACGEECVASFLILQNGQPVHAAYVCNNNRFGEIQLSQGNMIGVGDFTNQALVGSSFLIVTQRTMVENEEGESAPVDVITGLLPFTDEEVTPELQQRLAVAANVDMLAASRADGISVAGVAQQFIGDGEVRELKDVEEQPQFPGGADAMYSFLNRSVKYPEAELDAGVQGKVYVEFVVASDGSLRGAKVKRGVADSLDREALRVVRTMTRWTPGRVNGKPGSCRYILPITFARYADALFLTSRSAGPRVVQRDLCVGAEQEGGHCRARERDGQPCTRDGPATRTAAEGQRADRTGPGPHRRIRSFLGSGSAHGTTACIQRVVLHTPP